MPTVSTDTKSPITVRIGIEGVSMTDMEARRFASSCKSSLAYGLGLDHEDDSLTVEVSVTGKAEDEKPDNKEEPESEEEPEKATASAIADMTTAQYKAAKAEGRI